jgi:hypothetical protein
MSSWKCHNCGLVNFAGIESCRRCQTSATGGYNAGQYGQGNPQVNRAPQQGNIQAGNSVPLPNYQTGNLQPQFPQTSDGNFRQSNNPAPDNGYPQNPARQDQPYAQGGNDSQSTGYAGNDLYSQNTGYQQNNDYQQNSGYAYNNGAANNLNNSSQPYAGYSQTDYSQAPSYAATGAGGYSAGYGAQGAGVWQNGKKLVMHKQAQLPDRCIKCNAPTHGAYLLRKLSWMHQGWSALVLLGLLGWIIFAILSLTIKKKAVVDLGLCEQHLSSRRTNMIIGWAITIVGIGLFALAISTEAPLMILLGIVMFFAGLIIASLATKVVTVVKMDDNYIWLTRINKDYLSNFPLS